jgi:hypothetical protein
MKIKNLVGYSLALILTSCASSYGPECMTGGYDNKTISKGVYAATFAGNGYTDKARTDDLALLRACEVAKSDGYQKFEVLKSYTGSIMDAYQVPGVMTTSGSFSSNGYSSVSIYTPPSVGYIEKPRSAVIIKGLSKDSSKGYLIDQIMGEITSKYKIILN